MDGWMDGWEFEIHSEWSMLDERDMRECEEWIGGWEGRLNLCKGCGKSYGVVKLEGLVWVRSWV